MSVGIHALLDGGRVRHRVAQRLLPGIDRTLPRGNPDLLGGVGVEDVVVQQDRLEQLDRVLLLPLLDLLPAEAGAAETGGKAA